MLGYRSFFAAESGFDRIDLHAEARAQLRSWLRSRRRSIDLDAIDLGVTDIDSDATVVWLQRGAKDGTVTTKFRLAERGDGGVWSTALLVHTSPRDGNWILLDIHDPYSVEQGARGRGTPKKKFVNVPGLSRLLLGSTNARDGSMSMRPEPILLKDGDEAIVDEIIRDPDRRGLAILASTDFDMDQDAWLKEITSLTRESVGLAGIYVLNPVLTESLGYTLGHQFVPVGGIRTYAPGSDPESLVSARSNWYVTKTSFLDRPTERIARRLGWLSRDQTNTAPIPKSALRVDRIMGEFELETIRSERAARYQPIKSRLRPPTPSIEAVVTKEPTVVAAAPTVADASAHGTEIMQTLREAVDRLAGSEYSTSEGLEYIVLVAEDHETLRKQATDDLAAADRRLKAAQQALSRTEEERDWIALELEDARREIEELDAALVSSGDRIRYLRRALDQAGQHEVAFAEVPENERTQLPKDFEELLSMLENLANVHFVGDTETTLGLNDLRGRSSAVSKSWQALLALDDYGRARRDGKCPAGGVHAYLKKPPDGYRGYPRSDACPEGER